MVEERGQNGLSAFGLCSGHYSSPMTIAALGVLPHSPISHRAQRISSTSSGMFRVSIKSGAGTEAETTKELCLLSYSPGLAQFVFLYNTPLPDVGVISY